MAKKKKEVKKDSDYEHSSDDDFEDEPDEPDREDNYNSNDDD